MSSTTKTPVWQFKAFCNWAKEVLVALTVKPGDRVLDFGCGRGIDATKWDRAGVSSYVAVDASPEVLGEARSRWSALPTPRKSEFIRTDPCDDLVDPGIGRFDVVACLDGSTTTHRCCSDEQTARLFFANVSSRLKPGGVFVGIVPDSAEIFRAASKLQMGSSRVLPPVSGELHRLTFTGDRFSEWGTAYSWSIGGEERTSGFLLNWRTWNQLAAQFGLILLEALNFRELAEEYQQFFIERYRQQGLSPLQPPQNEIISLFTSFVFQKAPE